MKSTKGKRKEAREERGDAFSRGPRKGEYNNGKRKDAWERVESREERKSHHYLNLKLCEFKDGFFKIVFE